MRRLVERDLGQPRQAADPRRIFNLADFGGSDIARHKDEYVAEAIAVYRFGRRREHAFEVVR